MTKDTQNRDATIERLLEGLTRRPDKSGGECLDAETLAAWADDGLEPRRTRGRPGACRGLRQMPGGARRSGEGHSRNAGGSPGCLAHPLASVARSAHGCGGGGDRLVRRTRARAPGERAPGERDCRVGSTTRCRRRADGCRGFVGREGRERRSVPRAGGAVAGQEHRDRSEGRRVEGRQCRRGRADASAGARLEPGPPATATVSAAAAPAAQSAADASTAAPSAAVPAAAAARAFAFAATERVIVSSNPASRWRILRGGAVQRSADGGGTWQTQNTGVADTLSAGSSPSPSVCWLVGPGGIVLLSTDDRAWQRLPFPEAVPLVAVRATDDRTATVTTADGREFVTTDGGQQWARAPER